MEFLTIDGVSIKGRTFKDVVSRMSDEKLREPASLETYRKGAAKRAELIYGKPIRHNSDRNFVNDLVDAGALKRIK